MKNITIPLLSVLILLLSACQEAKKADDKPTVAAPKKERVAVPEFNADSAYAWVATQVAFGPRSPGSKGHQVCGDYLVQELLRFTPHVQEQNAPIRMHDGKSFKLRNIIASFNPDQDKRILLAAHWDTRPRAENDPLRVDEAIDGANDGASGVGVLLEIARNLALQAPKAGIDIIFFDLEDYGISEVSDSYCMGSQYWAANPHEPGYRAEYGILLDMVGGKGARFFMEGFSMYYAPQVVRKVWNAGYELGFSDYFKFQQSGPITDDHYYVNRIAGIPMIDIIEYDPNTETGFGKYWHTHDDNMDVIDRNTLKAVGQTVLWVIYQE
ncbi:MAG: M28 family peptidase [Bacteroidia bacterium]|jgi:glutaminyl-peptide cyclotransferase